MVNPVVYPVIYAVLNQIELKGITVEVKEESIDLDIQLSIDIPSPILKIFKELFD